MSLRALRASLLPLAFSSLASLTLAEGPRLQIQEQGLGPGGVQDLLWTADPENPGYAAFDVVRGDLNALRAGSGDFVAALTGCLAEDVTASPLPALPLPAPGQKFFFLVRAQATADVCGAGSWNEAFGVAPSSQPVDRGPGIAAGNTCPCP